jgi:hypothetical protein
MGAGGSGWGESWESNKLEIRNLKSEIRNLKWEMGREEEKKEDKEEEEEEELN